MYFVMSSNSFSNFPSHVGSIQKAAYCFVFVEQSMDTFAYRSSYGIMSAMTLIPVACSNSGRMDTR